MEKILPLFLPWLLLLALLPLQADSRLGAPALASGLGGYLAGLPQQVYVLIKALLPWLPFGVVASGLLARRGLLLTAAGITLASLVGLTLVQEARMADLLEILAIPPGILLGGWLGARALFRPESRRVRADQPAPERKARAATTVAEEAPAVEKTSPRARPVSLPWPPLALGIAALAAALVLLVDFPLGAAVLGAGLLLYGVLLWFAPAAWLVVLPAALPALDLAPWSGRFFLDEFDILLLWTAGILWLRQRHAFFGGPRLSPAAWLLPGLFFLLALASFFLNAASLTPDANSFSTYWSSYNGLRVLKGLLWGALLVHLIRLSRLDANRLGGLLALGMALGLLFVGLAGLWERWLFAGFADANHTYRIAATFSSMHTGGGHIEAWMAAAAPFLWLGFQRRWTWLPAVAMLALTVYVMLFTVARGGVLALGVVMLILALASVRQAWKRGRRLQAALPLGVLALAAAGMLAGVSGGYFQQRLERSAEDWDIRMEHWRLAASMMDSGPLAQLLGMGPGSFPRVYLDKGPRDKQSATYAFAGDGGNTWLRLGGGDTVYYAQRVAVKAGEHYRLELDVRAGPGAQGRIETPVCEKQLLNSRHCVWLSHDVATDGRWHRLSRDFESGEVGVENGLERPPVELFLYYPGKDGILEVDNLRLLDAQGRNLIGNGGFTWAGDYWFFKTHSHLPWHIKNVWVHVYFELGIAGLILFALIILMAAAKLWRQAWRGQPLAWVLLAGLAGMLTVGMFDSLLDAPRLSILLSAYLLLGLGYDWGGGAARGPRRRFTRHASEASAVSAR